MVPDIFTHVLHVIDLPVGQSRVHMYDSRESSLPAGDGYPFFSLSIFVTKGKRSRVLHIVRKAAKLIIYLLRPGGKSACVLSLYMFTMRSLHVAGLSFAFPMCSLHVAGFSFVFTVSNTQTEVLFSSRCINLTY